MIIFSNTIFFVLAIHDTFQLILPSSTANFNFFFNWNKIAKFNLWYTMMPLATNTLVNAYGFLWWTHPGGHRWDKLWALTHQRLIRLIHNDDRPFLRRCWECVCITSHPWEWRRPPGPHLPTPPRPWVLPHVLMSMAPDVVAFPCDLRRNYAFVTTVLPKMSWNLCIAWPLFELKLTS